MISGKAESNAIENAWSIRKRDSMRAVVVTRYVPSDRSYYNTILLHPSLSTAAPDKTPRQSTLPTSPKTSSRPDDTAPRPSDDQTTLTSPLKTASPVVERPRGESQSQSPTQGLRTSSMFTVRGEVRHPTDLMIGELVVDTKLYPEGYAVQLRSRIDKSKTRLPLPSSAADLPAGNPLPIASSVYTLPPSPLHSSGLNADRPPCHLLRLTLPTAQYQVSTIQDPLTGEVRSAPPKPQWLLDLEEGRAVISVQITPASPTSEDKKNTPTIDGRDVSVLSEKESLTLLGRDELLDGRTSKMDLLIRCAFITSMSVLGQADMGAAGVLPRSRSHASCRFL